MIVKGVVFVYFESIDGKKILKNIRYWVSFILFLYLYESYMCDCVLLWLFCIDYYIFVYKYFLNNIEIGRGEFCV